MFVACFVTSYWFNFGYFENGGLKGADNCVDHFTGDTECTACDAAVETVTIEE